MIEMLQLIRVTTLNHLWDYKDEVHNYDKQQSQSVGDIVCLD